MQTVKHETADCSTGLLDAAVMDNSNSRIIVKCGHIFDGHYAVIPNYLNISARCICILRLTVDHIIV